MRSPRTATKSSPRSPQLEKARAQQRRPKAAKNKQITNKTIFLKRKSLQSSRFGFRMLDRAWESAFLSKAQWWWRLWSLLWTTPLARPWKTQLMYFTTHNFKGQSSKMHEDYTLSTVITAYLEVILKLWPSDTESSSLQSLKSHSLL